MGVLRHLGSFTKLNYQILPNTPENWAMSTIVAHLAFLPWTVTTLRNTLTFWALPGHIRLRARNIRITWRFSNMIKKTPGRFLYKK